MKYFNGFLNLFNKKEKCNSENNKKVTPFFSYEDVNSSKILYDLKIVFKDNDKHICLSFDDFDVADRVRDNIVTSIANDKKILNYEHNCKNAIFHNDFPYNYLNYGPWCVGIEKCTSKVEKYSIIISSISFVKIHSYSHYYLSRCIKINCSKEVFDKKVEAWRDSVNDYEIYEYLGLTEEQYNEYSSGKYEIRWNDVK